MAAYLDTLRLFAQSELTENPNGKEVRHQVDKKETFIQTSRRGGEDSHCRGGTETGGVWDQQGRQSDHEQTLRPHIRAQINWDEQQEAKQTT